MEKILEKYKGQFIQGEPKKPAKSEAVNEPIYFQGTFRPDGRCLPKRLCE
jgi:hypothetical protein